MKAKDLAALLMQHPEMEVYHEHMHIDDMCEAYYSPENVSGIEITPSGVYISTERIDYNSQQEIKTPHNKPRIGAIDLVFHQDRLVEYDEDDGTTRTDVENVVFRFYNAYEDPTTGEDFFSELLNDGEVYGQNGTVFVLDPNYEPDHNTWQFYTPEDVMEVKVLTDLDDNWNPVYTSMTFEEAKNHFVSKLNITKE